MIGVLIREKRDLSTVKLPKLTTTDVLRVVVYLSGGDISLPSIPPKKVKTVVARSRYSRLSPPIWSDNPERKKFEFKSFKRNERRFILGLLEQSNLDTRDMKLKDGRWIRLGEILHPGEFDRLFPRTFKAFQQIRNEKVTSWYGEVDKAFKSSFSAGITKLTERAGEFLRRLDFLVRTSGKNGIQPILNALAKVGSKSSNKVLFEVYDHFEHRADPVVNRSIFIKGARKKTELPNLPAISAISIEAIQETIWNILKDKFAELPSLGDCWIDPELKKIPLPTNMRSLNDALVPTVRGTRTPFGTGKKVIRPFIHWLDEKGNLDLDLHGYLFGPSKVENFGYNGRQSNKFGCYSGDVRCRRGRCAEYVDINVEEALEAGFKYFLMIVHNFQGGKLSDIKDCVAGIQEREFPEANIAWLPDTIENSMLLKASGEISLIAAFDIETREYIFLDMDFNGFENYVHRGQADEFFNALAPFIAPPKVSVYSLLQWHVEARGRMVSKETAVTHFLFEDFASSYTKTIEFMGV